MAQTKIEYTKQGDYLIPNLTLPPQEKYPPLGKFGMLRRTYLKEHRKGIYGILLMDNELTKHLHEIDSQANEMLEQIMSEMAQNEGITEQMKADNQMLWVQNMNNIRNRAEEIVLNELIYS